MSCRVGCETFEGLPVFCDPEGMSPMITAFTACGGAQTCTQTKAMLGPYRDRIRECLP